MKQYRVRVTETAAAAIEGHAKYIATEQHAPRSAQRWLEAICDAVDSLHGVPNRARLAAENAYVDYEVRRLVVHRHILLYTVNEERDAVYILGVTHGHRLPRIEELPESQDDLAAAEE